MPWNQAGQGGSPFVKVMQVIGIPGAAGAINFVVLVAALSAMNSQLYITTRMMFSLSRAGHAPRSMGEVSRSGVPVKALLISTVGIALATVLSVLYPEKSFTLMMAISMFGAMFTWLMIFVTHYCFRRLHARQGEALKFRLRGFPFTTLTGIVLMLAVMITTAFTDVFRMTLAFGLPFLAVLSVVYWLFFRSGEKLTVASQRADS